MFPPHIVKKCLKTFHLIQVHLELDPSQSMDEEDEEELQNSALTRKEIIKDILSNHLGMEIGAGGESTMYTLAYFLGMHEVRQKIAKLFW